MTDLGRLVREAEEAFAEAADPAALDNAKARFLGKSGALTQQLKSLGQLDPEARKAAGAHINAGKERIEALLAQRRAQLAEVELSRRLAAEAIMAIRQVSRPAGRPPPASLQASIAAMSAPLIVRPIAAPSTEARKKM